MKFNNLLFLFFCMAAVSSFSVRAQQTAIIPDPSKINDPGTWSVYNREVKYSGGEVYMNAREGDGLLFLKNVTFTSGRIELDIKGKDEQGRSFVGLAFHGKNDSTFDAVYFRPFNFKNPDRKGHSVQYIAMPKMDWYVLRQTYPGKYENTVAPVPEPNEWFHASIQINYPEVKVFVNNSKEPSLTVSQISTRTKGWVGFWVGNGSDGFFRNLKIYPAP